MKNYINFNKFLEHPKVKNFINEFKLKTRPVLEYWLRLSDREQFFLIGALAVIVFALFILIISSAISYRENLLHQYQASQKYRLNAITLAKQYKNLSSTTNNDFSEVRGDRIKGDVSQALKIKNADVLISDNILTINVSNAKFSDTLLLIDQLRNSYGLFPNKLKITRLSQSGYVAFSASFTVSN